MSPELPPSLSESVILATYMSEFGLDREMIDAWISSRSRHLGGRIPQDLIEELGFEGIQPAVDAYLNGVPVSEFVSPLKDPGFLGAKILPFKKPE